MAEATTRLKTSGLHCRSCSMLVDMTLSDLEGVSASETDLGTGITVVVHDDALSVDDLVAAVKGAGYEAEPAA